MASQAIIAKHPSKHALNSSDESRLELLERENLHLKKQLKRARSQILELAHTADMDPLAPVYNRRAFIRELGRAQSVIDRYDIPSSVIFFDMDKFKSVNDRFGHAVGDNLIREIGNVLKSSTRDCDMVARLGGDEFGVLLFKTEEIQARAKADKLSDLISEVRVNVHTTEMNMSVSYGVAECDPSLTPEQTLSLADRDMFMAKSMFM